MVEEHTILVRMDHPFMIDVIDGINMEGTAENLNNITEEGNTSFNNGGIRQGGTIYCTDNIKEEDI